MTLLEQFIFSHVAILILTLFFFSEILKILNYFESIFNQIYQINLNTLILSLI